MKETGRLDKEVAGVECTLPMEIYMKENGWKISTVGRECYD